MLYASIISDGVFLLDASGDSSLYEIDLFDCGSDYCAVSNYIMTTNTDVNDAANIPPAQSSDVVGVEDAVNSKI